MEHHCYVVIGAGISGLAVADRLRAEDVLVLEAEPEIGGYCRTIQQDGFVWDYAGHFFHFRHPEIERELIARMPDPDVATVSKVAKIYWAGEWVDFPFQKNIHQLPREDFIDCLHGLHFRPGGAPRHFREMLETKFGRGIAERFLIPYNEKLYAVDLAELDIDAMGRFFPHADEDEIVANFKAGQNQSYNSTFTYPRGGAIQYVQALATELDPERLLLHEPVIGIDVRQKVVSTPSRRIGFEVLINTAPLPRLLQLCGVTPRVDFSGNRVLVFNLGFDAKGPEDVHWLYFPQRELVFYRVGFYDNIFATDRMSLYVEIGLATGPALSAADIAAYRERVLADLRRVGILAGQRLVAEHAVVMDPAYVHLTRASLAETARLKQKLAAQGIYTIGRYGSWTYCSIEDNIVEARALADTLLW